MRHRTYLTAKELALIAHIQDGKTYPEIAQLEGLSPFTVMARVTRVSKLLGGKGTAREKILRYRSSHD